MNELRFQCYWSGDALEPEDTDLPGAWVDYDTTAYRLSHVRRPGSSCLSKGAKASITLRRTTSSNPALRKAASAMRS